MKAFSIKNTETIRSPLFYVGDKYKLMPQLLTLFPNQIDTFYDVFCGGGSASLNVQANSYSLNDIDSKIIELHAYLINESKNIKEMINHCNLLIEKYGLSLSYKGTTKKLDALKKQYKKTYFSKYNKEGYIKLREDYNNNQTRVDLLYLLLIYGFNHMIRFNRDGFFNLPVGNVDWNKNVNNALINYSEWANQSNIELSSGEDFQDFVLSKKYDSGDFLYFDPPYLITHSDYNKLWSVEDEERLYNLLDYLDNRCVKWGLSNMLQHKGKKNEILMNWGKKYNMFSIKSNYISRFDNTIKLDSKEVYVTNYGKSEI